MKSNKYYLFWVCVCGLSYPACNPHAPYCYLWAAGLYNIFPHYLINGTISERKKKVTELKMCVMIFSTTFVQNISHSKNWERYDHKCLLVFIKKSPLFLSDLNETLIFSTYFRKTLKYTISWKSVQREPKCSMWTDRRADMTKLTVAFRNFANAPKIRIYNWLHSAGSSLEKKSQLLYYWH